MSVALAPCCVTELELRDAVAAQAFAEELFSIASEHELPVFRANATFFSAWTMAVAGRAKEGIDQMRRLLPGSEAPAVVRSVMKVALAEACAKCGRLEESLATVEEGLAEAQRNAVAEFHRVRGEVMLLKVPRDDAEAERAFRIAIEVARKQAARLYELRATIRLTRLLAKQGKRDEARAMLAGIYGWFTEGFDTADLKDAKALLERLNG